MEKLNFGDVVLLKFPFTDNKNYMKSAIYLTTPEQNLRIKEGIVQIADGDYFTNEQVEKEIDDWLKEK
jgi:predicted transcriptional regulator